MKHLTREERRRIQRRSANIRFTAFVLVLLGIGITAGYAVGRTQASQEPPPEAEVSTVTPAPETPTTAQESPEMATPELELIGTFRATAYCPCVKCCGIWSAEHPDRGEDYVQRTSSGTIPEEGRTIAADWDVLPQGSEVILDGHTYIVEDTGGAVNGNSIDIFFEDHEDAVEFGVQEVELYREKTA